MHRISTGSQLGPEVALATLMLVTLHKELRFPETELQQARENNTRRIFWLVQCPLAQHFSYYSPLYPSALPRVCVPQCAGVRCLSSEAFHENPRRDSSYLVHRRSRLCCETVLLFSGRKFERRHHPNYPRNGSDGWGHRRGCRLSMDVPA